jgi:hypothetical protein
VEHVDQNVTILHWLRVGRACTCVVDVDDAESAGGEVSELEAEGGGGGGGGAAVGCDDEGGGTVG